MKTNGFTLAEVLITLGIIGVVAAMTLPTVINNTNNKELQVRLQKTYSELNQISRLFMEHNGLSVPQYITKNGYNAFLNEFPNYLKEVYKVSDWTNSNSTDEEGNSTIPYPWYRLDGVRTYGSPCDSSGLRSDIIGRYISFDDEPAAGYNGPRICVDVNGEKKPNTWGIDIFTFQFTTDGFVIPEGQDHKDNNYSYSWNSRGTVLAEPTSCRNGDNLSNVIACAYYALLDKNPQGNGKYWKDFIGRKLYK